ncbi:sulfurase, partial [Mycobacterium sp. ITM-2017-0098]
LRIPALSPGWQTSLRSLADQAENASPTTGNAGLTVAAGSPPPGWSGFRPMDVTAVAEESRTVRSISLADPDRARLPEWLPGQSITVRLPVDGDQPLIRNYSLSNQPGSSVFRISVKREKLGLASGYIHSRLKPGDRIDVAAPRGTFFLADHDG